jgi:hypothetical protein
MPKYRVLNGNDQFSIEAETVSFNLDYNMTFFRDENDEVIAACLMSVPFYKVKDEDAGTD